IARELLQPSQAGHEKAEVTQIGEPTCRTCAGVTVGAGTGTGTARAARAGCAGGCRYSHRGARCAAGHRGVGANKTGPSAPDAISRSCAAGHRAISDTGVRRPGCGCLPRGDSIGWIVVSVPTPEHSNTRYE